MKNYSVIWDGSEDSVKEQINYLSKWARKNGVQVRSWKEKTLQERVCLYVGNPKKRRPDGWRYLNNIEKKYAILKMSDTQLEKFKSILNTPFQYETKEEKEYAVLDSFTAIKHTEELSKDYFLKRLEKFNNGDTLVKEVEARLTLGSNQKRSWECLPRKISRNTSDAWTEYTEIISTSHDAVFEPWVVLDEDGLSKVGEAISKDNGTDITELQKKESELINAYNSYNNACGRIRCPKKDVAYSPEVLEAYNNREQAGRELREVRSELGKAKRKMTNAAKKNDGISFDMTPYSVV